MSPKTENIVLAVAALGLAFALYKVFSKPASTKPSATAPTVPAEQGGIDWMNGSPVYTGYAPFNSNTLGGQLEIAERIKQELANQAMAGWY